MMLAISPMRLTDEPLPPLMLENCWYADVTSAQSMPKLSYRLRCATAVCGSSELPVRCRLEARTSTACDSSLLDAFVVCEEPTPVA